MGSVRAAVSAPNGILVSAVPAAVHACASARPAANEAVTTESEPQQPRAEAVSA